MTFRRAFPTVPFVLTSASIAAVTGAAVVAGALVACGSSSTDTPVAADAGDAAPMVVEDAGTTADASDGSIATTFGIVSEDDGGNQTGCTTGSELIYLIDSSKKLQSYNPGTGTFGQIGTLSCPSAQAPVALALDRSGTAWVNYGDGTIFKVSITDASCQSTAYTPGQAGLGLRYGMAFAANAVNAADETLYVAGTNDQGGGSGLGIIDINTLMARTVADYSNGLAGRSAQLTAAGDGRLFGLFQVGSSASLAPIDRVSAETPNRITVDQLGTGDGTTFAFWGGDFWFFTPDASGTTSSIYTLKASSDNSVSTVQTALASVFVAAGVSTCAPTVPDGQH